MRDTMLINSPHNPRIRSVQELHTTRGRKKSGLFLLEGPHLLETLLAANIVPQEVYYEPALLQRTPDGRSLLNRLLHFAGLASNQLFEVNERVIAAIGEVQTSQGVVSVLPIATLSPERLLARRLPKQRPALLILDNLADPGNLGTILRTALAADVQALTSDPSPEESRYGTPLRSRIIVGALSRRTAFKNGVTFSMVSGPRKLKTPRSR